MAYGKFAPKMKIPNANYGNSWDDVGYAIGAALGNLWGTNYNQRGIEKGEAEAQKALQEAYNKVYGTTQPAPEALQEQYNDITSNLGGPQSQQAVPKSNDANTYIDVTKKYTGGKGDGKTLKAQAPQRDIRAEKFDTFMSKYNSGTPNPDGDSQKVDALTQAANGNLANMDFSKLPSMNAEDLQSAIRKELRANGRTDYQIEKVLENLSPTIKAKVQEGNNINFGNLYNTLNQQIKNGELDAANMTFAKMSELNPKMAAALQPKMKRAWDATALEQNFQNKFSFYKQDPNLTEQQAYNLARYGSIYNPAQQAQFMGVRARGGDRNTGGGSNSGSSKARNTGSNVKLGDWEARNKWADEVLSNPNSPENLKDSATRTKQAYNKFMAGDNYVVPKDAVYSEIEKSLSNGEISPQEAYDWVWGDSGLGDAEKREIATWINQNYRDFNGDYVSEDAREGFFGATSTPKQENKSPSRASNKPIAQGGALGEWLKEVGDAWDKAMAEAKRRKAQ